MIARPCAASRRTPSLLPTKKALSYKICVRLLRCFPQGTAGALDDEMVHPQPRIRSTVSRGCGRWRRLGVGETASGEGGNPDKGSKGLSSLIHVQLNWLVLDSAFKCGGAREGGGRDWVERRKARADPLTGVTVTVLGFPSAKNPTSVHDICTDVERSVGYDCSRKLRSSLLGWGRGNHRLHANFTQHLAGCISADAKTTYKNVMARKNQKLGRPIEMGMGNHSQSHHSLTKHIKARILCLSSTSPE
ncbi:hypothetical protein FB45DRAFT_862167 [Roridomyces roridus]|uniref:Uncharacterized protein n=1 Tax=Roridomyces roridus TaxID=1738132 RepID=A0AAD7CCF2_9AGAR|nr:hypothetical protein FB45DRAFT_862167 [Roridomyces roridus]